MREEHIPVERDQRVDGLLACRFIPAGNLFVRCGEPFDGVDRHRTGGELLRLLFERSEVPVEFVDLAGSGRFEADLDAGPEQEVETAETEEERDDDTGDRDEHDGYGDSRRH